MPLPNTRIIPKGWSQHHAGPLHTSMNATVQVGTPGKRQHDPASDRTTQPLEVVYAGPARIEELNQASAVEWAGQEVSGRLYLVQVPYDVDVLVRGQRMDVTTAENDPQLAGRTLWLVDVRLGSERFTRDLVVSDTQQGVQP